MNNRVLLTLSALALPVVALALAAQYKSPPAPPTEKKAAATNDHAEMWVPLKGATSHTPPEPPSLDGKTQTPKAGSPPRLEPQIAGVAPVTGSRAENGASDMFDAERERVRNRLQKLEGMSEADFAEDQKKKPRPSPGTPPLTLEKARERTRKRLSQLEAMTADSWAEEQRERLRSGDTSRLSPEQRASMEQQLKDDEKLAKGPGMVEADRKAAP